MIIRSVQLLCFSFFITILTSAQATKKTTLKETVSTTASMPAMKVHFLRKTFLLDTAVISSAVIDSSSSDSKRFKIGLKSLPSANITIIHAEGVRMDVLAEKIALDLSEKKYSIDENGFNYEELKTGKTTLQYNGETVQPLEYKLVSHGTEKQKQLDRFADKMPSLGKPDAKTSKGKSSNKYDTDKNNRVLRIYLLRQTSGINKGCMVMYYNANFGEDRDMQGGKVLQQLVSGISNLNISELMPFKTFTDKKVKLDIALPSSSVGSNGLYTFTGKIKGSVTTGELAGTKEPYTTTLEKYIPATGCVLESGKVEEVTLANGLKALTRTFTINAPEDKTYRFSWYETVTVLMPDKKMVQKPVLITVKNYSESPSFCTSLNAYILNSISAPGTLTKARLTKVNDTFPVK